MATPGPAVAAPSPISEENRELIAAKIAAMKKAAEVGPHEAVLEASEELLAAARESQPDDVIDVEAVPVEATSTPEATEAAPEEAVEVTPEVSAAAEVMSEGKPVAEEAAS
jgi:hypothetical protein